MPDKEKVHKVLKEYKEGNLKDSHGKKVTSRKQATAIAMREGGYPKKAEEGVVVFPKSGPPSSTQLLIEGFQEEYGGHSGQT